MRSRALAALLEYAPGRQCCGFRFPGSAQISVPFISLMKRALFSEPFLKMHSANRIKRNCYFESRRLSMVVERQPIGQRWLIYAIDFGSDFKFRSSNFGLAAICQRSEPRSRIIRQLPSAFRPSRPATHTAESSRLALETFRLLASGPLG